MRLRYKRELEELLSCYREELSVAEKKLWQYTHMSDTEYIEEKVQIEITYSVFRHIFNLVYNFDELYLIKGKPTKEQKIFAFNTAIKYTQGLLNITEKMYIPKTLSTIPKGDRENLSATAVLYTKYNTRIKALEYWKELVEREKL